MHTNLMKAAVLLLATSNFQAEAFTGDLTVYGGSFHSGNCGLTSGSSKAQTHFAAIGAPIWDKAMKCGQCVSVKCVSPGCPSEPKVVMIADQCPECAAGDLDFNTAAYNDITGGMSPDRLEIEWDFVTCPSEFVSGNVQLHLKEGSSIFWIAIQPLNFKVPIQSIKIQHNGGTEELLPPNQQTIDSFYFKADGQIEDGPITLIVTSIDGQTLTKPLNQLWNQGTTIEMDGQFMSSDNNTPLTSMPETMIPETMMPETMMPETMIPETMMPETLMPETLIPETLIPETMMPETLIPETMIPETLIPETMMPETLIPETLIPETLIPETLIPETLIPETLIPETMMPLPQTNIPTMITSTEAPTTTSPVDPNATVVSAWEQCGGMTWTGLTMCVNGYDCVKVDEHYSQCQPSPIPAELVGKIVLAWGQCGGSDWTGLTECVNGYSCVKSDDYYSQCRPTSSIMSHNGTIPAPTTTSPVDPNATVVSAWEQCGGMTWTGLTMCVNGYDCVKVDEHYSQCQPSPIPTELVGKIVLAWGQCGGKDWTGLTECVNGYSCVKSDDYYSQCLPSSTA